MTKPLSSTPAFKRDLKKLATKPELLISLEFIEVMYCLQQELPLAEKYKDLPLKHNWNGFRECHIKPDLLLIYLVTDDEIRLTRLGSHSELFD